jgi:hypothetical protein
MKKNRIRPRRSYTSHPIGVAKTMISTQKFPRVDAYTKTLRTKPIIVDVKMVRTSSNLHDILLQNDNPVYDMEPIDENDAVYNDLRSRLHELISDDTDKLSESILSEQSISTPHVMKTLNSMLKPFAMDVHNANEPYYSADAYNGVYIDHNGFISFEIPDILNHDICTPLLFTVMSRIHTMCMLFRIWSLQKQYYNNHLRFDYRRMSIDTHEISWAIQSYLLTMHIRGHRCVMIDNNSCLYVNTHTLVLLIKKALTRTLLTKENALWVFSLIAKKILSEWV